MNRFAGWQQIGEHTFTPQDTVVSIGGFSMEPDDDTIWVRMVSETPPTPWPWSYGILGWKTSEGYELGTVKAYSEESGQVFRLGLGLAPVVRTGVITFAPRGYNLAWVKKGNPWTLRFEAQGGNSSPAVDFPDFGGRATLGVLSDLASAGVSYAFNNGLATIRLTTP